MIYTWVIAVLFGHGMAYIPVDYPTQEVCQVAAADYVARYQKSGFFKDVPSPRGAFCQSVLVTDVKTKGK